MKALLARHFTLCLAIVFWVTGFVVLSANDEAWTRWLMAHRHEGFSDVMGRSLFEGGAPGASDVGVVAAVGSLLVATIPGIRFGSVAPASLAWRALFGYVAVCGVAIGAVVTHAIKIGWGRARPSLVILGDVPFTDWWSPGPLTPFGPLRGSGSFPSGHVSTCVILFALALASTRIPRRRARPPWVMRLVWFACCAGVVAFGILMTIARSMAGRHWLTDSWFSLGAGVAACLLLFHYGPWYEVTSVFVDPAQPDESAKQRSFDPLVNRSLLRKEVSMTLRILVLALCLAAGLLATRLAFAADVTWVRARTLIANEPLANEMRGRAKTVARAFEARCPSALLNVNASGYSESDGGRIGFEILLDGRPLHRHEAWTYRRMQSVPLQVAGVVLDDLVAGAHLLQIRYLDETHTDPNDRIHVSLLEACVPSSAAPAKLARGSSSAPP